MSNRLTKLSQVAYRPAVKAVPARPARCVTTTVLIPITGWVDLVQNTDKSGWVLPHVFPPDPHSPEYGAGMTPVKWSTTAGSNSKKVIVRYDRVQQTTCFPAVPEVVGRDAGVETAPPGWDAGARSIQSHLGDVYFAFDFGPDSIGVLVGLAPTSAPVAEYNAVSHGFLLEGGVVSIVESGVPKGSRVYDPDVRPDIRRIGTTVMYRYGDWEYVSSVPLYGGVVALAVIYTAGDFVDSPVMAPTRSISCAAPWGWSDWTTANSIASRIRWGWGGQVSLGDGLVQIEVDIAGRVADYEYSEVRIDVGGVHTQASGNPVISTTGVQVMLPTEMYVQGVSVVGLSVEADVGGIIGRIADYDYTEVIYNPGEVRAFPVEFGEAPGSGMEADMMVFADTYTTDPVLYAALGETLQVGGAVDLLLAIDASMVDYLVTGDHIDASMLLAALLSSKIQVSDSHTHARARVLQYVTNILTGAVGRYDGFDFAGFVRSGMDTYGWKPAGLYRLAYAEDTGELVQAMIEFAAEDFDTTNRKAVRGLFLGADTDGALYARLVDDNDCEATYRVIPHGTTHRANPAQRPTSRFWRLRLEIADATFADLDNVEWKVVTTNRRTRS